jgi:transcription initiation factor TFIIIB Brf1 subunit/transcription initiation factor TFIIB
MTNSSAVALGAAFLSGSGLPWAGKMLKRLFFGNVEHAEHVADAEARREAAELERLVAEIARLSLERKDREALVDLLRHELDKALVRGNATLTMARILLFAVDQEPKPSPAMIAAREQARAVINAADEQMQRGN